MGDLGLNEHHQDQIVQFLRFSRYQRNQRIHSVKVCFEESRKSRLNDTTYNRDEVLELLKGLEEVIRAEMESELINTSHTTLLLMRQMCGQAENWHLKLSADLSELENRELLDAVQQFEESQFNLQASQRPQINLLKKLEPIEGAGAAPLLQGEIERLRQENTQLRTRLETLEGVAIQNANQKQDLQKKLEEMNSKASEETEKGGVYVVNENMDALEKNMTELKTELSHKLEKSHGNEKKLEDELQSAYQRFLEVKEQLEMAEKELEKKFSHTNAYKNLKQILTQKNQQIKELRSRLGKYETDLSTD